MYEPYTTQCGHTFCYSCLRQWFDRDHTKKTCPDCRAHVVHQPAPAYLVREITQTFINTAVLLPHGETTEGHKNLQREEAEIVERDKAAMNRDGGLFNGRFKSSFHPRAPIYDGPDGVVRCPMCTWELEDGMCNSCGYTHALVDHPYSGEDEDFMSDAQSFSSLELENVLAEHSDPPDYDSTSSVNPSARRRRHLEHIRRRVGLPPSRRINNRNRPSSVVSSLIYSNGESEDDLDNETGSPSSSLRDFMVDDLTEDEHANIDSDNSADSEYYGVGPPGRGYQQPHPYTQSSRLSGESSDTTLLSRARQRARRRRAAASSPGSSDSELSDHTRSSHQPTEHETDSHDHDGFSPLQRNSADNDTLRYAPIQIDSDSDSPPIRRMRKRPTTVPISSDEEDHEARGVAIENSTRNLSRDIDCFGPNNAARGHQRHHHHYRRVRHLINGGRNGSERNDKVDCADSRGDLEVGQMLLVHLSN
ncbi:MAG: hypothetical protein Q9219_000073 [cf. Caloplaca sp. 3 TL-2023]